MRYHYEKPSISVPIYGKIYTCNHPVYTRCTLYELGNNGLAVIQQRFDPASKRTWWGEIDSWLANDIYLCSGFYKLFEKNAEICSKGLYPTMTVRQVMWALKMKPLHKEPWETVFDRTPI